MKKLSCGLILAAMFCAGCGEAPQKPPSTADYRRLLEKRVSSVNAPDIDIRLEVSKYEISTDEEKFKIYKEVEARVR